jgi:hypothetical protein
MQKYKRKIIKFFKQLSIVDYLLALMALLALVFAIFYFDREKQTIHIDMLVSDQDFGVIMPIEKWQFLQMAVGDEIYNFAGDKIAEVVFIDKVSFGGDQKFDVYLTLEIEALYDKRKRTYSYLGKPLVVGKNFDFTTEKYFFEGEIIDVYQNVEDRMSKFVERIALVDVKIPEIENVVIKYFHRLFLEDYSNQDILKFNSFKYEPAKSSELDSRGRKVVAYDPLHSDVYFNISLRVWCLKENTNNCFYSYRRPLMVNDYFYNDTESVFLFGTVLDYTFPE